MDKIPVAKHLSDDDYKLLITVYLEHTRTMGLKKRENYTASHIVKIEKNVKENCLNVHYENGDWWKYYRNGTWG